MHLHPGALAIAAVVHMTAADTGIDRPAPCRQPNPPSLPLLPQCYVVHMTAVDKNSPPSTNGLAPIAIGFAVFLVSRGAGLAVQWQPAAVSQEMRRQHSIQLTFLNALPVCRATPC